MHHGYDVFDPSMLNKEGIQGDFNSTSINPYDFDDDDEEENFISQGDYHYNSIDAVFGERIIPKTKTEMDGIRKKRNSVVKYENTDRKIRPKQQVGAANTKTSYGQTLGKTKRNKNGKAKSSKSAMQQKLINLKEKVSEHRCIVSEIRLRVKELLKGFYTFDSNQETYSMIPLESMNR